MIVIDYQSTDSLCARKAYAYGTSVTVLPPEGQRSGERLSMAEASAR